MEQDFIRSFVHHARHALVGWGDLASELSTVGETHVWPVDCPQLALQRHRGYFWGETQISPCPNPSFCVSQQALKLQDLLTVDKL